MSKKPKTEKKVKEKKPKDPVIVRTVFSSLTALICVITVCISALTVTNKLCDAYKKAESDSVAEDAYGDSTDDTASPENSEETVSNEQTADESTENSSDEQTVDTPSGNSSTGTKSSSDKSSQAVKKGEGLNSTDKAEVISFYKAAAKATGNNINVNRTKTLAKLDGGKGTAGNIISKLESAGKKALSNSSGVEKGFRGTPELITADDITSATASVSGNYTNLTLKVKDYTALPTGKANEGSVGHAIGVLNTIDEALRDLPLTVDDPSNIRIVYTNASVTAKIDNKTNKVISAKWTYDVTIKFNTTDAKAFGIPFTLDGAEFTIHYDAVYGN